jgi:adenylate cyclase
MLERALQHAYRRLGPRYPLAGLVALFSLAYVIGLFGVALLRLYQDMSAGELAIIAGVVVALVLLENVLALRVASRLLRPADAWLHGDRSPRPAVDAWRSIAGLPINFLSTGRWAAVLMNMVPVALFVTLFLDLEPVAFLILIAGSGIVLAYGVLLRFFGMELVLRPLLADVSSDLPDGADLGVDRVPIKWKLLLTLPAINVITGVFVSGLSNLGDEPTLADFGWSVAVAVAVAFTITFELTLLLTRSVGDQLYELRRGTERLGSGERGVRVPVLTVDETGGLASSFNAMAAGLDERERLAEAFGAFVAPDVVERVLEQGTTDLEGEEVEVSVLFLDIRGFTALAERSSAREVVMRLNDFYGLIVPLLVGHGGHANKFVGDGLLGVFGAPERVTDHADRAVLAAMHIARTVQETYGGELQIGIGVNSGPVLAGTIGGGGHIEFTVIGDAVNTAARVEEATRVTGDDVLITEATRRLLTLPFRGFEERPGIQLKGKSEQVVLYAPLVESPAPLKA